MMIRLWTAVALLAGSWLFALGYYQPANFAVWAAMILGSVFLLSGTPLAWPGKRDQTWLLSGLLASAALIAWPYNTAPLLLAIAMAVRLAQTPRRWPGRLADGAALAGVILLVQTGGVELYCLLTARAHELPGPLAALLGVAAKLLGVDAAVDGGVLAVRSMQETHRIAASWDLLFDLSGVLFLAGGTAVLWVTGSTTGNRGSVRSIATLVSLGLFWSLLRAAILLSVLLHRIMRADLLDLPNVGDVFVNAWIHLLLLGGLALLTVRFVPGLRGPLSQQESAPTPVRWRDAAMIATSIVMLAMLYHWDPVGKPRSGRVMVVERHSTWEPTTTPYGTEVYGEAGSYNYAAAFAYCEQYFEMSRLLESDTIDDAKLSQCDVLVIKTPTARYSQEEVAAVIRFVQAGGSLLLIGDHTNVFNMNTYLNDIGRPLGVTFRNDLLFRVGSPYTQKYHPPPWAHPVVQHMPPMNFAVSCSVDPGFTAGRMVIRNWGLYNLPPAYQESNYHPQAEYRPHMQYGAWCQLWSSRYGSGRVMAFADSTLLSNFCVFQPGKAELLRGMLNWLNHRSVWDRWAPRLTLVAAAALVIACLLVSGLRSAGLGATAWLWISTVLLVGWTTGAWATTVIHRASLPVPQVQRPWGHVVIDRTVSDVPLFTGAFADGEEGVGYGMLEQWIPRVGNYLTRETGEAAFGGDALVVICPTKSVPREYRDRLVQYVAEGGHLVVFDSIEIDDSTANSLLWPFGLASNHHTVFQPAGVLQLGPETPAVALQGSCEITGGEPLAYLGEMPAAAQIQHGQGTVTAIGFAGLFNDAAMGFHWLPEPEIETSNRYEALYALLRAALPPQAQTHPARDG